MIAYTVSDSVEIRPLGPSNALSSRLQVYSCINTLGSSRVFLAQHHPQVRQDIFDMGGFDEFEPAHFNERELGPTQLNLKVK